MKKTMTKPQTKDALFPLYIIARLLKSVFFWIPISNFNRWKNDSKIIKKDLFFLLFSGVVSAVFWLASNWIFAVIILTALIVLIYAFLFALMKNKQ
jgi:hypothetical protein